MKLPFTERRKAIKALNDFNPSMVQDEEKIPVMILIVGLLAIIGSMAIVYVAGIVIINLF